MNSNVNEIETSLCGKGAKIAIAVSRFNEVVTSALLSGAVAKLTALGVSATDITVAYVPGAFELPGVCRKMIASKKVDAVIVLGAVIRGETPHFDVVVNAVTSGIAHLAATSDIPVLYGVLTTDNVDQAMNRAGLKCGNKGADCALSAVEMIQLYKNLK